jgi:orotidine-5'-phosphate decarboxylase
VIAALAATHQVLVLAGLHGDATRAATAARRYAGYGATWVTTQAADGPALVEAAAATGARIVAVTLRHGQGDAEAASVGGRSRGKAVSRLAESAVRAGAEGVLCDLLDLGVVAQVAPDTARFVWVDGPADAVGAAERGAEYVIVDAAVAAETTAAIAGSA